jgi:hypothetical protein
MRLRGRIALLALALSLVLLLGCGVGMWSSLRPPLRDLILPNAVGVQIVSYGFGEQQITYRSPGRPYGWYFMVVRNLAADGWIMPIERRDGLRTHPEVYWRIRQLWLVYLKEEVALQGDPNVAQITIRRDIIIPWRRWLGE